MKRLKRLSVIIAAAVLAQSLLTSCAYGKKYKPIEVSFLKVGKADAIVIRTQEHAVLIDAANQGEGKEIFSFCEDRDFTDIDYFILTHFDSDHVGGAKAVVNKFNIGSILQPDYSYESEEYNNYQEAAKEKGYEPSIVKDICRFELDDAVFTVYPAKGGPYEDVNNYSLITTVEHGNKAFVFAGDAEQERIKEACSQLPARKKGYDLVKMPHHGGYEKNLDDFLDILKPHLAVITCSAKEPADKKTLRLLEERNIDVFNTYDGTVTFTSDGYNITDSVSP